MVLATLHTSSAIKTIDRIIDIFPTEEKQLIRTMLAESLNMIISQTLIKKADIGRIAAYEVLLNTTATRHLIKENKLSQIYSYANKPKSRYDHSRPIHQRPNAKRLD